MPRRSRKTASLSAAYVKDAWMNEVSRKMTLCRRGGENRARLSVAEYLATRHDVGAGLVAQEATSFMHGLHLRGVGEQGPYDRNRELPAKLGPGKCRRLRRPLPCSDVAFDRSHVPRLTAVRRTVPTGAATRRFVEPRGYVYRSHCMRSRVQTRFQLWHVQSRTRPGRHRRVAVAVAPSTPSSSSGTVAPKPERQGSHGVAQADGRQE